MARKQIQSIYGKYPDGTYDIIITEHDDPCDSTGAFMHWDREWVLGLAVLESWEIGQILGGN